MKVYAEDVGSATYLTANKQYEAIEQQETDLYSIIDDEGDEILIYLPESSHISNKKWTVIND